ncbi:MAG: hypothetical protein ACI9FN_000525 [Saprospiraceae bacterium]|jgi:uncharacterized protein (DUF885 family)
MIKSTLVFLYILCTVSLFAQEEYASSANILPGIMIQYQEDDRSLKRFYHIIGSPERNKRLQIFYDTFLDDLHALRYDQLSVSDQVDYQLIQRKIENELHLLDIESKHYEELKEYISIGIPIYSYEAKRRRGLKIEGKELAATLFDITKKIESKTNELEKSKEVWHQSILKSGKRIIKGQQEALKSIWEFYNGYDPEFTWWIKAPRLRLDTAWTKYAQELEAHLDQSKMNKDDGSGIIGSPTGREELLRLLDRDMIPYSPEELVEIALKEFAWCDQELLKASREMGFGDNWEKAQEKVKQSYLAPSEQPEAMLRLYNESISFLKDNDLITIPPLVEEVWRMEMLTPKQQLVSPFFLGGETLYISYPTDEMGHEAKMMSMRGNNPHFSRATVHHELIAGHHLQGFMNRRFQTHRRGQFRTPFWMEGWALYWELLLYEKEFPKSPEDRIGMLFWRMHRCARIIFSLNYHLEEWSPQQCIDFLVDRVGHEQDNAEAEVRRSFTTSYPPLYQLAYMTGGLQFRALREELVGSGKMQLKEFHDRIIRENAMPIEMLRFIMKNEPVPKDFESNWRFYNVTE